MIKQLKQLSELSAYGADITYCIHDLLRRNQVKDINQEQYILKAIVGCFTSGSNTAIFISIDDKDSHLQGFMLTEIYVRDDNHNDLQIHYAYIKPLENKKIWDNGIDIVEKFAIDNNCQRLRMESIRNPKALQKKLGKDWKPLSMIFIKEIKHDII